MLCYTFFFSNKTHERPLSVAKENTFIRWRRTNCIFFQVSEKKTQTWTYKNTMNTVQCVLCSLQLFAYRVIEFFFVLKWFNFYWTNFLFLINFHLKIFLLTVYSNWIYIHCDAKWGSRCFQSIQILFLQFPSQFYVFWMDLSIIFFFFLISFLQFHVVSLTQKKTKI